MPKVDDLYIEITSEASDAHKALDKIVGSLTNVQSSLRGIRSGGLKDFSKSMSDLNRIKFDNKGLQNFTNSLGRMGKNNPANGIKDLVGGFKELSELNFDNKNLQSFVNSIGRLGKANVSGVDFAQLSSGMSSFVNTMSQAKNVDKSTIQITNAVASLAKQGGNIGYVSSGLPNLSNALLDFSNKMSGAKAVSANTIDFTKALGSLASAGKRTAETTGGLSALAKELLNVFNTLSKAPKLRGDIVRMAGALGDLARAGSRTSSATRSLSKGLNMFSASAGKAKKKSFSLAGAIGKLYATYWILFRSFEKIKKAIDISSALVEVQNVVNTTFGDMSYKVEKFAQKSIEMFGMSELTAKKTASTFQSMGTAMGIDANTISNANKFLNEQTKGYVGLGNSMADVSLNLTKLTADMTSLYGDALGVSHDEVAEDLRAIFTGQTEPLANYGLILTETTLKEWALNKGLNANIESMTGAEKAMLRYQYVLSNTGAARNDFLKNIDTWSNQVRILRQNLEQLSIVVGRTFINALKPLVKYLNVAVQAITQFAQMVSDALGKIFGWKYEVGSGGITADMDDAADGADDLSSGIGQAANNAKKLKQQLQGFHELNVLTSDTTGAIGGNGSGTGAGTGEVSGGTWTQDADSMFKAYESEIDTLYQLGAKISETLSKTLSSIDWNTVYQKAQSFGVGLASFLNGLITPELFGNIGTTIANALNTVLTAANTFAVVFDWKNLGNSLAQSVNDFFDDFDWKLAANTMNNLVDGLKKAIGGLFEGLTWDKIFSGVDEFLGELELDTITVVIGTIAWEYAGQKLTMAAIGSKIATSLATGITTALAGVGGIGGLLTTDIGLILGAGTAAEIGALFATGLIGAIAAAIGGYKLGTILNEWITGEEVELSFTAQVKEIGLSIADGTWKSAISLWKKDIEENLKAMAIDVAVGLGFDETKASSFIEKTQTIFNGLGKFISISVNPIMGITEAVSGIKESWSKAKEAIGNLILKISIELPNVLSDLQSKWNEIKSNWGENKTLPIGTKTKSAKKETKSLWKNIKSAWKSGDKKLTISTVAKLAGNAVSSMQNELDKTKLTLHADVEFKIEDGVRLNWDSGVKKWFYYRDGQKYYMAESGGIFKNGKFKNIPQYAEGGFPSHGTHFIAGENGAEVVGHINGQTEVLNQSQLASVMYESMQGANAQTNALLVRQNQLLQAILEKETGISYKDVFKATKKGADEYNARTGKLAFA